MHIEMSIAKFEPGRPNIALVERPRLLAKLDDALTRKLALVVAPPGFGKSTIMHQWYDELDKRGIFCAWLNLSEDEGDPQQFISSIVLALAFAGLPVNELEVGAQNGFADSSIRSISVSLNRLLRQYSKQIVLSLDDYHLAEISQINALLVGLLQGLPDNVTIVVNSRKLPSIDAPVLIAEGAAIEIGPSQLRLTADETQEMLGDLVDASNLQGIYEKTEGWPIAIQLARVQIAANPDSTITATNSGGLIAEYLTGQVLSGVDDDIREFLLNISVLDRFSPMLVDHIRGRTDSWSLLHRLQAITPLLIPLDSQGDWFRLHHLFAEYLFDRLRGEYPERVSEVCLAAAHWYQSNEEPLLAVKYAAQAGDYKTCTEWILAAGGWKIILTDSIGQLRGMLRYIPSKVTAEEPRMLLARAYLHCKDGELIEARELFDLAVTEAGDVNEHEYADILANPKALVERDVCVVGALVKLYVESDGWERILFDKEGDAFSSQAADPLEAGTLMCEATLVSFAKGDLGRAENCLGLAFRSMRASGSVLGLNYCYIHAAVLAFHKADFEAATAHISRANELAENNFGSDSGLTHLANVLQYVLKYWQGEIGVDDLQPFSEKLSYLEEFDGWAEVYILGLDAAYHLALKNEELAFAGELLNRFRNVAEKRGLVRLEQFVKILTLDFERKTAKADATEKLDVELLAWFRNLDLNQQPLDWFSYCVALEKFGPVNMDEYPEIANAAKSACSFIERHSIQFQSIRLGAAFASNFDKENPDQKALDELKEAVILASRQKFIEPFLNPDLTAPLRHVRDALRADEKEIISGDFAIRLLDTLNASRTAGILSPREQEILELLASGLSNRQIAKNLELTENTVKYHLKKIFYKLGVNKRTQAISASQSLGLL